MKRIIKVRGETIQSNIEKRIRDTEYKSVVIEEINQQPSLALGECKNQILLVLNQELTKCKVGYLPFDNGKHIVKEQGDEIDDKLSKVKLVLIDPLEVFDKKPGLSSLIVENFDVNNSEQGYIVTNCDHFVSNWLLSTIINSCENLDVVIAPYTSLSLSKVQNGRKIKFLSIDWKLDPSFHPSLLEIFPSLITLQYSHMFTSCLTRQIGDMNNSSIMKIDGSSVGYARYLFIEWLLTSCKLERNFYISLGGIDTPNLIQMKNLVIFDQNIPDFDIVKRIDHLFFDCHDFTDEQFEFTDTYTESESREKSEFGRFLDKLTNTTRPKYLSFLLTEKSIQTASSIINQNIILRDKFFVSQIICIQIYLYLVNYIEPTNDIEVKFDFGNFSSLKELFIHCVNLTNQLIYSRKIECLSLNYIPKSFNENIGIKEFNFYFDHHYTNREDCSNLVKNIIEMKNLVDLTLIGYIIPFTYKSWEELFKFIRKLKTLKNLIVLETISTKQASELYIKSDSTNASYLKYYKMESSVNIVLDSEKNELKLKTSLSKSLEFVDWRSFYLPMQILFDRDYNFLYLYDDRFMLTKSNGSSCFTMIDREKNGIKYSKNCIINYLSIDSLEMFHRCFVEKNPKGLFASMREKTGRKGLQFKVITITNSYLDDKEKRNQLLDVIMHLNYLNVLRGELLQSDLYYIFKHVNRIKSTNLNIFVTGKTDEVTTLMMYHWIKIHSEKNEKIDQVFTPWRKTFNEKTFLAISSFNIEDLIEYESTL